MALVGPGRSGTTWAGTLVDSCPDVVYRFEPFHRMSRVEPAMKRWFDKLRKQEVRDRDLPAIYECLRRAHPLTNKAPFFDDKSYPLRTAGRSLFWPAARAVPLVGRLYGALYSPTPGPPVVFKEVTFIRPLQNLLERTSIPVVYVVRHPCATVMSSVNVQMREGVPQRVRDLRATLQQEAPDLVRQYPEVLDGDDVVGKAALLWRFEVGKCVSLVRASPHGVVITYEQLAEDAHTHARMMFKHFGIPFGDNTERYIESLHVLDGAARGRKRRTGWGARDFNVYRNPREEKDAWKARISMRDRGRIEAIVQGVPEIEACAAMGRWW